MGSPVSAVIAELSMEQVEQEALAWSPVKPRWWRRYVDDSNACLKKDDVDPFHNHLKSINHHIQFTLEMPSTSTGNPTIAFLDTNTDHSHPRWLSRSVKRKATHTNKYLSFDSHSPAQSKIAVVKTLMDPARCLPSSTAKERTGEEQRVVSDLTADGYPAKIHREGMRRERESNKIRSLQWHNKLSPQSRILKKEFCVSCAKRMLGPLFVRSKHLVMCSRNLKSAQARTKWLELFTKSSVDRVRLYTLANGKRSWNSRGAEHKPGTRGNNESAIKQHVETAGHDIHPNYVEILERGVSNRQKRLFLESWLSTLNTDVVNGRQPLPKPYLPYPLGIKTCLKTLF